MYKLIECTARHIMKHVVCFYVKRLEVIIEHYTVTWMGGREKTIESAFKRVLRNLLYLKYFCSRTNQKISPMKINCQNCQQLIPVPFRRHEHSFQ